MSNPFKDAQIRKDQNRRRKNAEDYEPVVLWVKPGRFSVDETGDLSLELTELIRRRIRDEAGVEDYIDVLTSNEPRVDRVETEFDEDL